tara:strand:- start:10 stop:522 length:513 start_codon:yes stop_codon:yes gene_type:complete
MTLKAIIFDVDGALANTEWDGHLKVYNEAFKNYELDWYWDSVLYGALLSVSGGKERLAHYIDNYNPKLKQALTESEIANINNKKLASDIYDYVLDKMNLNCSEYVVIEDSEIGFQSATAIGLKTVITLSEYTNTKNFEGALVVLDHLGEDNKPFQIVNRTPTTHTLVSVD